MPNSQPANSSDVPRKSAILVAAVSQVSDARSSARHAGVAGGKAAQPDQQAAGVGGVEGAPRRVVAVLGPSDRLVVGRTTVLIVRPAQDPTRSPRRCPCRCRPSAPPPPSRRPPCPGGRRTRRAGTAVDRTRGRVGSSPPGRRSCRGRPVCRRPRRPVVVSLGPTDRVVDEKSAGRWSRAGAPGAPLSALACDASVPCAVRVGGRASWSSRARFRVPTDVMRWHRGVVVGVPQLRRRRGTHRPRSRRPPPRWRARELPDP